MRIDRPFWCALTCTIALASCAGSIDGGAESPGAAAPRGAKAGAGQPGPTTPVPTTAGTPAGADVPVPGGVQAPAAACVADPGRPPLRKLTAEEYVSTIRDLLGVAVSRAQALDSTQLQLGAEEASNLAVANMSKLVGCDPATGPACVRGFVEQFGKRAFRRPLEPAEVTRYVEVFSTTRAVADAKAGVQAVVEAFLQSPTFFFRPEIGTARAGDSVAALTPWELASRLSYLLLGSMPDQALFTAAEQGALSTAAQVAAQTRRLLELPQARKSAAAFQAAWLGYEDIEQLPKDQTVYPRFSPALTPLLREETNRFLESVMFDRAGDFSTIFTGAFTYLNKTLADFYGIPGPTGTAFVRVALTGSERVGVLTQASLLAAASSANQSSPVLRGKLVRTQLLCTHLPDAPPGLEVRAPDLKPGLTTRERFSQHAKDPSCSACHRLMDPIGLGFESYDGIGRHRTTEAGKAIDASGELVDADVAGAFVGVSQLAAKLAISRDVRRCAATQWFRHVLARPDDERDRCAIDGIVRRFTDSGHSLLELVVALTESVPFRYRSAATM